MSAINQNIQSLSKYPLPGNRETGYFEGNKELQACSPQRTKTRHDFLKAVFKPKKALSCLPVFGKDVYDYLHQSAVNYAKLIGHPKKPKKDYNVSHLYDYMKSLLCDRQKMTLILDRETGLVSFYFFYDTDFFYDKRYYIPCGIINKTGKKLGNILMNLLNCISAKGIYTPCDDWDYDTVLGEWSYEYGEELSDDQDDEKNEYIKLVKEYGVGGKYYNTLKMIDRDKADINKLKKAIKNYTSESIGDKKIIEIIKRGIPLLEEGSIFSYMRDAWEEVPEDEKDNGDYEILTHEYLIRFVYDSEDKLTKALDEIIDSSIYASSHQLYMDIIPATEIVISPETKEPLTPAYPELFFWWLEDLITAFENYGKPELIKILNDECNEN